MTTVRNVPELEAAAAALREHDAERLPLVLRAAEAARRAKAAGLPAADIADELGVERSRLYRAPWHLPRGFRGISDRIARTR